MAGPTTSFESPNPTNELLDSPIPVVGVTTGSHSYGMAAASTWDEPMPGYTEPHLLINHMQEAAPQIGTDPSPVELNDGQSRSFTTVFFRGAPGTYGLSLAGELATAQALGLGSAQDDYNMDGNLQQVARHDFGTIGRVTAYWLRMSSPDGGTAIAPSAHYAHFGATSYMRDSFWTTLGLSGTEYAAPTESAILGQFTSQIPRTGPQAGHVAVSTGGPLFNDESGLYYLIRMYHDVADWNLPVKDTATATLVLNYIRANQVSSGSFLTAGPIDNAGFEITPDSWLDGYLYPTGAVDAYDQGLYVVALEAAQKLGVAVSDQEIAQATAVYRGLYDPALGYVKWLSTKDYRSPDVLGRRRSVAVPVQQASVDGHRGDQH